MIVRLDRCHRGEYLSPASAAGLIYPLSILKGGRVDNRRDKTNDVFLDYWMLTGSSTSASEALEMASTMIDNNLPLCGSKSHREALESLCEVFNPEVAEEILCASNDLVYLSDPQLPILDQLRCGLNQLIVDPTFSDAETDLVLTEHSHRLIPHLLTELLKTHLEVEEPTHRMRINQLERDVGILNKKIVRANTRVLCMMTPKGGLSYA